MSLGPLEILLIVVVIALLFGAKKLPELMKGMGQGIREFKSEVKDPVPPAEPVTTQTVAAQTVTAQTVAGEPITDIPSRHLSSEGETVVARVSESAAQATAAQPSAVQPGDRR